MCQAWMFAILINIHADLICSVHKSWKCDITGVRGLHYIDLKHVSPFISSTKSI